MVRDITSLQMDPSMKELGKMVKCMVEGNLLGKMEMCMREIGKMISGMVEGNTLAKMERCMREIGKMMMSFLKCLIRKRS